jgi:hypothetical protein
MSRNVEESVSELVLCRSNGLGSLGRPSYRLTGILLMAARRLVAGIKDVLGGSPSPRNTVASTCWPLEGIPPMGDPAVVPLLQASPVPTSTRHDCPEHLMPFTSMSHSFQFSFSFSFGPSLVAIYYSLC